MSAIKNFLHDEIERQARESEAEKILREILRRIADPTGEPTACRLDPDLLEKVKRLFEDEQV